MPEFPIVVDYAEVRFGRRITTSASARYSLDWPGLIVTEGGVCLFEDEILGKMILP